MPAFDSLIFRITAGFGTLRIAQVAGFHRAVPSTALDKVFNCVSMIDRFCPFVNSFLAKFLLFIGYSFTKLSHFHGLAAVNQQQLSVDMRGQIRK